MSGTVTVGLDDSPESRAAAEWAVRAALLRAPPSKIVHVQEPTIVHVQEPTPRYAARTPLLDLGRYQHRAEQLTHEAAIRLRHPGIEVITGQLTGTVADVLCEAAGCVGLLVLGSRALGGPRGFMVGPVGLGIVGRAECPVVLLRAEEQAADEHRTDPAGVPSAAAPFRPVVLGLDIDQPDDTLLEFAFDTVARCKAALRAVHAGHIGHVPHAALHHITAPVAVVAHS
ncbi:stress-inducible protein [Streptomyces hygroscopicus subsp. limoneus]|nr:stress-inducible protein [Streptomyces hygroscopicus subsp. limoneus]